MEQNLSLLKELCTLFGVAGCEDAVRTWLMAHLPKDCTARVDARGNLICEKKGQKTPKNTLMFAAHMDEVGFIITHIEDCGLLRFETVGGIDTRVIIGKPVVLENGVSGVVGGKAIHLQTQEEREKTLPVRELSIDIGAMSREEAEKVVSIGDFATFRSSYDMLGDCISGKALDNRVGCFLLLELLNRELPYDITAVFTAQEEIGGAAECAAFAVKPDIAVVLDVNTAADVPGVGAAKNVCTLGKGPVFTVKDKGGFSDRGLFAAARALCQEKDIPYQVKNQVIGATDAAGISKAGAGCKTLTVAVPARYIHSPAAICSPEDLAACGQLLTALVERFGDFC